MKKEGVMKRMIATFVPSQYYDGMGFAVTRYDYNNDCDCKVRSE